MYTFVWMPCFLPILIHETTDSPNISIVHVHIWYQLQFATCGTQQLYQHNVEFVYTWYRIGKPPGKCVRWSHNTHSPSNHCPLNYVECYILPPPFVFIC
jgi:hypothetical protein